MGEHRDDRRTRRRRREQDARLPHGFRDLRDALTAALGAGGIVHETVIAETERPTLLIVFAGLLGLPLVFRETDKSGGSSGGKGGGGADSKP